MDIIGKHLQSKCFRLGPIISSVVALTTARPSAEPTTVCLAALSRSTMLWPDIWLRLYEFYLQKC